MAEYSVQLTKKAAMQLDKLLDDMANSLLEVIGQLVGNSRPQGCKKLKGRNGYRIRK